MALPRLRTFRNSEKAASFNEVVVAASRVADRKERLFIERRIGIPVSKLGEHGAYLSTGSKRVWATFRACHLVASVVQATEMKITSGPDSAEVVSGPMVDLLESPNPMDSWDELTYQWVFHMKLTGNAYWLKDELDRRGRPRALYPLLPHLVEVVPDRKKKVAGYIYKVNGTSIPYSTDEIIHFRRPHPTDMLLGMGDIEPSVDLYQDFINRNKLEEEFMRNGAMPSGILFRKAGDDGMIPDKEWGRIKRKWQAQYGGKSNAGKTAFVQGDWSYLKLGLTAAEMQSVEREKMSIDHIFMNHGVPLSIAGVQKAANFATAKMDRINFRTDEIVPLINILTGKLNSTMETGAGTRTGVLVRAFNESWRLSYELAGLVDVEQVMKDYGPLFDRGGMTLNELRAVAGLDEVDNPLFGEYFTTRGRIPLELAGLASPTDSEFRDAQAGDAGRASGGVDKFNKPISRG